MGKKKSIAPAEGFNEILLYTTPDGHVKVEIYVQNETIWLTQQRIADLFGVDRTVVTRHIGNIFRDGELQEQVVCAFFAHTTPHGAIKGKTQEVVMYMSDWVEKLDAFLQFNEETILNHQGTISHELAFSLFDKLSRNDGIICSYPHKIDPARQTTCVKLHIT